MTFTPEDFVKMEAQRRTLVEQYLSQRDQNKRELNGAAMTEDKLQAIEARANAATPGPWEVEQKECTVLRAPNGAPSDQSLMGDEQYYPWTPDRIEDWQFIAAARTDVPALVAEVRRLRAENEQMAAVIATEKKSADAYVTSFDAEVDRRATAEAEVEFLRAALHGAADVMPAQKFREICSAAGLDDAEARAIFLGQDVK